MNRKDDSDKSWLKKYDQRPFTRTGSTSKGPADKKTPYRTRLISPQFLFLRLIVAFICGCPSSTTYRNSSALGATRSSVMRNVVDLYTRWPREVYTYFLLMEEIILAR